MGIVGDVGALVGAKIGVDILSNSVSKNAPKWKKGIKGWRGESTRHSMSRYGIKTGRKTLSVKKARKFAIEEKNTAKTYKTYGFPKLAKDEARHSKVFKKYVDSKTKKPAWQREIDARIKKGNGFEEISDNVLTNYPKLDNWAGREKIEKYYNKQYAKSDVQAGWF